MAHEIPLAHPHRLALRELRDARGCFRVPARFTESIGEIGSFNVGRRTVVVINSGELTTTALTEHGDAFVPLGGAADCAWRLLANGALIKTGRSDGARSRADRRAFAAALHAQLLSVESMPSLINTIWRRLAEHPDVRARLQRELDGTLKGRTPRQGDLHRLPYTLNVIRESLRLDPPVVMFSRRLARDIELGGYVVRAGSIIVFNARRVQRCVSLFPCPDVFNPDRFDAIEGQVVRTALGDLALGDPARSAGDRCVWALTHLVLTAVAQRLSLAPRGASHTVSAVRSDATHAGAPREQVQPRSRRWWHPLPAWPVARTPVRHHTAGRGRTLTESSAVDGGSNLILTCEALRAAC